MKGTSCVRWLRFGSFQQQYNRFSLGVLQRVVVHVCVVLYALVESLVADRSVMAA